MNERELKTFWRIAGAHIVFISVLLLAPILHGCFQRQPEEKLLAVIDLSTIPPAPQPEPMPEPEPEPEPQPEPEPEPEPQPEPEPEPEEKKIEISRKRVRRQDAEKPKPRPTPEQIRQALERKLADQADSVVQTDIPAWYYAHVRERMNAAWVEPTGLSLPPGAFARVVISVDRSGLISSRSLQRSSGNSIMDKSVMRAVDSVANLKPLPEKVRGRHKDIIIDFELE